MSEALQPPIDIIPNEQPEFTREELYMANLFGIDPQRVRDIPGECEAHREQRLLAEAERRRNGIAFGDDLYAPKIDQEPGMGHVYYKEA